VARLIFAAEDHVLESIGLPVLDPVALLPNGKSPVIKFADGEDPRAPILVPRPADTHLLLAPPDMEVLVGCPLIAGTSILEDHDQLRVGSRLFRYTTCDWIDPQRRERFDREALCPVDMLAISPGEEAVFCPRCGYGMHVGCITPDLEECLICGCPVAHSEERAMELTTTNGGLK